MNIFVIKISVKFLKIILKNINYIICKNVENSLKNSKKIVKENENILNNNEYFNFQNGLLDKINFS